MRKKKGVLLLLCLVLVFSFLSVGAGEAEQEEITEQVPNASIYFINVSTNILSGDCILIESDGHYGIIDAGHRSQSSIDDEEGNRYYCSYGTGLSCQAWGKYGESIADTLVRLFNVRHLDFVLATHSHSDHIGGIPGLVNYSFRNEEGETCSLVDSTTVYFYKRYHHTSSQDDDLIPSGQEEAEDTENEEESGVYVLNPLEVKPIVSWHNQAFYYQALKAMKEHKCILADLTGGVEPGQAGKAAKYERIVKNITKKSALTNVVWEEGDAKNLFDDSLSFDFGKVHLRLYNLLPRATAKNDNVNSIVATLEDGVSTVLFTGDINVENQTEQKIAEAVYADVGHINLMKAAHHGAGDYSNSRRTFDLLQPEYCVVTSRRNPKSMAPRDAFMVARTYAEKNYGTLFYEAGATKWALLAELYEEGITLCGASGSAANLQREDLSRALYESKSKDGWTLWENEYPDAYEASEGEWMYFKDGEPLTGWIADRDRLFYFGEDGFRKLGLQEIDGEWYYFWPDPYSSKPFASIVYGWLDVAEGLFYFNEDGTKVNGWFEYEDDLYYFGEGEPASVGWTEIDGKWYYFDENGVMQTGWREVNWPGGIRFCYLGEDGAMCFGRQEIDGNHFYFREDGSMAVGWETVDGILCYFREDGTAASGLLELDGKRYLLDEDGQVQPGWQTVSGKTCYCSEDGAMLTGWNSIEGKDYYFGEDGVMATGWVSIGDKEYCFDENGNPLQGWHRVERDGSNKLCRFDKDGALTFSLG